MQSKTGPHDLSRPPAWRVAEPLEYGMIGTAEGIISLELALFGANKSGQSREGSPPGIDVFVELNGILMEGLEG